MEHFMAVRSGKSEVPSFNLTDLDLTETVRWIPSALKPPSSLGILKLNSWRKFRSELERSEDNGSEYLFIPSETVMTLRRYKDSLSHFSSEDIQMARAKANPFELIGKSIFMNRAGVKIANLDAIVEFCLTNPRMKSGESLVEENGLFYFADICAGPGAFSEYILWRKSWESKGFGLTLRSNRDDFTLNNFIAGPPESFEPYYGKSNNGNILEPLTVSSFVNFVMHSTKENGVHLVMGDGGLEIKGSEDRQEELTKPLVLAQCVVALAVLRTGGNFVCKMFDMFTPFSVGLLYLMYRCFEMVSIHKPHSSRPGNSERYLICKSKREDTYNIFSYLYECHALLWKYLVTRDERHDIVELVSLETLKNSGSFFNYIIALNTSLAKQQVTSIGNILVCLEDSNQFQVPHQINVRNKCLQIWRIPNEDRSLRCQEYPDKRFLALRGTYKKTLFSDTEIGITAAMLQRHFKSFHDWRFCIVQGKRDSKNRGFYFGTGGNRVYRFDNNSWIKIKSNLELVKDTCVYAEFAVEVCKRTKKEVSCFVIIDGFLLGGKDIRNHHYFGRYHMCSKYTHALNKLSRPDLVTIRMTTLRKMEDLPAVCNTIYQDPMFQMLSEGFQADDFQGHLTSPLHLSAGLLFIRITKRPWVSLKSKSMIGLYWYNTVTKAVSTEPPLAAIADFRHSTENRFICWFDKMQSGKCDTEQINKDQLIDFIKSHF